MIARIVAPLFAALAIVACASIDPPAPFTPNEAGASAPLEGNRRCRNLPRAFGDNVPARLYGPPGGPQAVCLTLEVPVPSGGNGRVTFCVAGTDLSRATKQTPRELGIDRQTCAYCVDIQTNCPSPDAGSSAPCQTSYIPTQGAMVRIRTLGTNVGDDVSVDVGDLVAARIATEDRDAGTFVLDPLSVDCLFADGLTFQGTIVAATCSDDSLECRIANSAASRFP